MQFVQINQAVRLRIQIGHAKPIGFQVAAGVQHRLELMAPFWPEAFQEGQGYSGKPSKLKPGQPLTITAHLVALPWVVEVDRLGNAKASGPAEIDYQPSDPQVAQALARFTAGWRGLSIDPIVVRQNWLEAYAFTTDHGAAILNDWARLNDPFAKVGRKSVAVEIVNVVRASASSFQVKWVERAFENGALQSTDRFSVLDTLGARSRRPTARPSSRTRSVFTSMASPGPRNSDKEANRCPNRCTCRRRLPPCWFWPPARVIRPPPSAMTHR